MNRLKLCPKHYTGTPYQVETSDERKCDFCIKELYERMEYFGIHNYKHDMELDKEIYLGRK